MEHFNSMLQKIVLEKEYSFNDKSFIAYLKLYLTAMKCWKMAHKKNQSGQYNWI